MMSKMAVNDLQQLKYPVLLLINEIAESEGVVIVDSAHAQLKIRQKVNLNVVKQPKFQGITGSVCCIKDNYAYQSAQFTNFFGNQAASIDPELAEAAAYALEMGRCCVSLTRKHDDVMAVILKL